MSLRSLPLVASLAIAAATLGSESAGAQAAQLMACFVPRSGTLYLVGQNGAPSACRATDHVLVQWNTVGQEGPAGNTGPQGPAGPAGNTGQQGPPGPVAFGTLSGIETVVATFRGPIGVGADVYLTARCPVGKTAIGGGLLRDISFGRQSGFATIAELGSYPNWAFGYSAREWIVVVGRVEGEGGEPTFSARVVAICAKAS